MIRTKEWKYVRRFPYGPHELYDLVRNPYEPNNLIDEEAYKGVRSNLQERLHTWQEMTRDDEVLL